MTVGKENKRKMKSQKIIHFNNGWVVLFILMLFLDFFLTCLALQNGNFYETNKFTSFLVGKTNVGMGLFFHAVIVLIVVETLNVYCKKKFLVDNLPFVVLSTAWLINNVFSIFLISLL